MSIILSIDLDDDPLEQRTIAALKKASFEKIK
jgi:hypothetical protein